MKAVLLSVRPEWCEKILNGEKTVEIRKSCPAHGTPFKVYIYCTKAQSKIGWLRIVPGKGWLRLDCTVIGEFVCTRIDTIQRMGIDNNFDYCYLSLNEFGNDDIAIEITDIKKSCIRKADLNKYGKNSSRLYAWHISDLKNYDKPKSLSGFSRHDFRGMNETDVCGNESCEHYQPSGSYMLPPTCAINGCCLSKPPQSWCYVAEAEDDDAL